MTELRALTSVRGIAAWLVVLYHIRGSIAGLPAGIEALLAKGYLAVDFFFLLSGFVIWLTWHDRLRAPGATLRFLQKRIARIWPLHAVMLAFAIALALLLDATGRHDPAFPFAQLPLHVLLLQNWGFTDALRWNDPAWSISCELAAYLLFPLLMLAVDWRRLPGVALIGIAGGVLLGLHLAMSGAAALGEDIPRYGLIRCLCECTVGTILAAAFLRTVATGATSQTRRTLAIAALATLSAATAWGLGTPETLAAPATLAGLLLTLALTANHASHPLEGGAVHYLGEISYATYLGHFLLWFVFKLMLVEDATDAPAWVLALYVVAVIVSSELLYRGVERPAQGWLNRLGDRRRVAVA